jgi:hypothetical protein
MDRRQIAQMVDQVVAEHVTAETTLPVASRFDSSWAG